MVFKTLASAVLIGLSGAALAQMAGAPIEQKGGNTATGNDMAAAANGTASPGVTPADPGPVSPDNAADRGKR